jgi:hypothetical protein
MPVKWRFGLLAAGLAIVLGGETACSGEKTPAATLCLHLPNLL